MRLIRAILVAAMLLLPVAAQAADPPRRLAHYTHQRWTEGSEAPAPVFAIAQGRDGYLWLATGEGLFRFDGIAFERIEAVEGGGPQGQPSAVLVTRNGDVWTNFDASGRFAVYRGGALHLLNAPPTPNRIMAFAEGLDGAIWALTAKFDGELLRFLNGRWQRFDARQGLPRDDALSMLVARDGALWISFTGSVVRLAPGAERFEPVQSRPDVENGRLSQDPAGRIWLSEKRGSYPLSGPAGRGPPPALAVPYPTDNAQIRGAPRFDRAGNLWIATRYGGVQRVAPAAPPGGPVRAPAGVRTESVRGRDGLSSDVTYDVMEDREGNIWIGTEKGLDKFRPATVRAEPQLSDPAAFGDKLMSASDGTVYIGESKTIYRVLAGGEPEPILRDVHEPEAICEAPDGAVWVAFAARATVLKNGRVRRTVGLPDRGNHGIIFDCAFDASGAFWISAAAGGVHRYSQGRWQAMFGATDENGFYPMTLASDPEGRLILQWGRDSLAWIDAAGRPSRPVRYGTGAPQNLAPVDLGEGGPQAVTLYAPANGDVFAAGAFGISRARAGIVQTVWPDRRPRNRRISGIVQTPEGDTWIAFPRALERFRSKDLERAFSDRAFSPPILSLGFGDGLTSRPHSHTQRSIVRGGDGRLWIATETGTVWMDPARIVRNNLSPGVAIRSLTSDRRLYRDPTSVKLRAGGSNIEIDYAVLSFADPRRTRVRYRLEGFDQAWLDPGTRRQAFYTNLRPGKYRFRVIAANAEGAWNRTGAVVDFEIPPTFVQSRWFLALCLGLVTVWLWVLYRLRVTQVAERVRVGLEARTSERERIARELHDTLLQSVQGLILRFQSVANRMPTGDPSRDLLETALTRADDVILDGRNRVRDLRIAEPPGDLRAVLQDAANAAGFDPAIPVRVVVEGVPRAVQPLVSAEIGRLASEALFNIVRHARARSVDVVISFTGRELGIQIRDDGVGFAKDLLETPRQPGHFGLVGMRERAQRIGGAFSIANRPERGAEVTLKLPARLAFADPSPIKGWLSSLLHRLRKGVPSG